MPSKITNKKEIFPSIYIAPTVDNTERAEGREAGAVCSVGYFPIGNPHYALNIIQANMRTKSIDPMRGGNIKNITLYHIKDHINEGNARVFLARMMGADSTLKVVKCVDAASDLAEGALVNVFGANNITEWGDTTPTDPLEMLLTITPERDVTVDVDFDQSEGYLDISLWDEVGNKMYAVEGHIDPVHENDYGHTDYIGNLVDEKYLVVKTIHTDDLYNADFSKTKKFTAGTLLADAGAVSLDQLERVLRTVSAKSDYMPTFDQQDTDLVKMLVRVANEVTMKPVIDIHAETIDQVESIVTAYGIYDDSAMFIWNRTKYVFKSGTFNVGLSGWFTGRNVRRNLSQVKGMAEYRNSGIAGVRHPVPRNLPHELPALTRDEKTRLTKLRVNTIEEYRGKIVLSDVLSSQVKKTDLMKFPTADSLAYIKRSLGFIAEQHLYKNLAVSKSAIMETSRRFMDDCRSNAFFDSDVALDKQYTLKVYDEGGDTVVTEFVAYMEGIMRKGEIRSTIEKL